MENQNIQKRDEQLKMLFGNLKEERLPEGFRQRMMLRIEKEAERKSHRLLVWTYVALITASLLVIGTIVSCFWVYDLKSAFGVYDLKSAFQLDLSMTPQTKSIYSIYIAVGGAAFFLLWIDYRFREWYKKRHPMNEE
mgnify:FL=1